ncbi:hypothetical protein Y1Q_0019924 [Alligator mississippiensis]|uniref:G-protein coupled receptors family 1 profile domain-containing protein n=1 Tax=Alligator mississippiensis TaxID=8496 RepID=A0A151MUF8_ALLMI|nr:hypothetical protein Y1Q_0019924 [Alligator mississippiensis]
MFYGSCIFMYVRPTRARGLDLNKGVAILNTVVTPLLNPFIYSLRNKQVQELPLCGPYVINHFFCDSGPVIKLACTDTQYLEFVDFILATGSVLGTFILTIISYINILSTILHIPSASGRQKAFSTCVSHLTVVSITYGSCIFMYIKPTGSSGVDLGKSVALLNNVVSPLLNPFIYSLRNTQVKKALRNVLTWNNDL